MVGPQTFTESFVPISSAFGDELFEELHDGFVKGFFKTIRWRIICRRCDTLDSESIAKSLKPKADELCPIVVNYSPRDSKTVDDVMFDELDYI